MTTKKVLILVKHPIPKPHSRITKKNHKGQECCFRNDGIESPVVQQEQGLSPNTATRGESAQASTTNNIPTVVVRTTEGGSVFDNNTTAPTDTVVPENTKSKPLVHQK